MVANIKIKLVFSPRYRDFHIRHAASPGRVRLGVQSTVFLKVSEYIIPLYVLKVKTLFGIFAFFVWNLFIRNLVGKLTACRQFTVYKEQ